MVGVIMAFALAATATEVVEPSFDCAKAVTGSIDRVICADRELSILDRMMDLDYRRALIRLPAEVARRLRTEQRAFVASRNRCMARTADRHSCIAFAYESRIEALGAWIDGSAWRAD